jgi:DNA-binding response OmpR family regulator
LSFSSTTSTGKLLKGRLEREGGEAESTPAIKAALEKVKEFQPRLILIEHQIPAKQKGQSHLRECPFKLYAANR